MSLLLQAITRSQARGPAEAPSPPPGTPASGRSSREMSREHPQRMLLPHELESQLESRRASSSPTAVEATDGCETSRSSPLATVRPETGEEGYKATQGQEGWRAEVKRCLEDMWVAINPTLLLTNSGSVARDHLASERTFLAYVRTSIAISSMGVALVQLFKISSTTADPDEVERFARPLGALIVGVGLLVLLTGSLRYFAIQRLLVEGKFPATRILVTALAVLMGAITCVVFGILVAVRQTASQ